MGERAGKKEMRSKKINFSNIPELSDTQLSRMRRVDRPTVTMNRKAHCRSMKDLTVDPEGLRAFAYRKPCH
jgi:hypothetical protein